MQNAPIKVHVTDKLVNVSALQDLKVKGADVSLVLMNALDMEPVSL
jgi:hypothetical protein